MLSEELQEAAADSSGEHELYKSRKAVGWRAWEVSLRPEQCE